MPTKRDIVINHPFLGKVVRDDAGTFRQLDPILGAAGAIPPRFTPELNALYFKAAREKKIQEALGRKPPLNHPRMWDGPMEGDKSRSFASCLQVPSGTAVEFARFNISGYLLVREINWRHNDILSGPIINDPVFLEVLNDSIGLYRLNNYNFISTQPVFWLCPPGEIVFRITNNDPVDQDIILMVTCWERIAQVEAGR